MLQSGLFFKSLVIAAAIASAVLNLIFAPIPVNDSPYTEYAVRAAGFTFPGALIIVAGMIPTGEAKRHEIVDWIAKFVGLAILLVGGWYSLVVVMDGRPNVYFVYVIAPIFLIPVYLVVTCKAVKLAFNVGNDLRRFLAPRLTPPRRTRTKHD